MSAPANAADCSTADGYPNTRISTQADVDNFQTVYGPCDTITRDVIIEGGPFTNLFGLSEIVSITGELAIKRSSVESLAGLSNLASISSDLRIESQLDPSFANLTGLSSLANLGGLYIEDTNFLYSLSGMSSLVSLQHIYIYNARILVNLDGLSEGLTTNFTSLSGDPTLNQPSLQADLGIKSLILTSNDSLQSLDGLPPINGLQELIIEENPNLTSISALAGSTFDDSNAFPPSNSLRLAIADNPKLTSLAGVPTMPLALNSLSIIGAPQITDLSFLDGLLEVWGPVEISSNPVLSDCSALTKVVDTSDDGYPGPNENTSDPALFPPDVADGQLYLASNASGCNAIAEILDSGSGGEDVFKDGFETITIE
jgi:hypothetical protein